LPALCFAYAPFVMELYLRCLESFRSIMAIVGLIVVVKMARNF
jgi:hypothetical protein